MGFLRVYIVFKIQSPISCETIDKGEVRIVSVMLAHDFLCFPVRRNSRKTPAFSLYNSNFFLMKMEKNYVSSCHLKLLFWIPAEGNGRRLSVKTYEDLQTPSLNTLSLSLDKHASSRITASLTIFSTGTIFSIAIVCYTREQLPLTLCLSVLYMPVF